MQYLLGLIGLLAGGLFFFKNRAASAEAINQNVDTKNKVNNEDQKIAENNGNIASEKDKIAASQTDATKEENQNETNQSLVDFLNRINNRNK